MHSEKASVTVLTQALASFFLSNFFLTFLMGFLLVLEGNDVSETPGNSPCFQCFFLTSEDEEELEAEAVFDGEDETA